MKNDSQQTSWLNHVATVLCAVCFGMLLVGMIIEAVRGDLLFEDYISTFTAYGIIFAVIASLSRLARRAR